MTKTRQLIQIEVRFTETRCSVCWAGSPGTCTPVKADIDRRQHFEDGEAPIHAYDAVTVASGYAI